MIARELRRRGFQATSGYPTDRPERFDVLVQYTDQWQEDITMYLLNLRIDMRDAENNTLLATGSSYQSSLARKDPEEIVAAVIAGILEESSN